MDHQIDINVINSDDGQPQSSNGIMGLFVKGVAVPNKLVLDTPYLLTSKDDLAGLGIDAAYDATNSTAVYQQVTEYYNEIGPGALLWLVVTAIAANPYATYVASNTFAGIIQYTGQNDPANRVKMIGLCYEVPAATQNAAEFPVDVTNTLTALQTVQAQLFKDGYQFSAILDGYNMSTSATPAGIVTMANKAAPSVSLCITGSKPNGVSSVGEALAKFAKISIGRGVGAVEDGPVSLTAAYLTNGATILPTGLLVVGKTYVVGGGDITYNAATVKVGQSFVAVAGQTAFTTTAGGYCVTGGTPVASLKPAEVSALGSKQYFFLRKWLNKSGYFWNDGATCDEGTNFLGTQENNRVANYLSASVLSFLIDEIGKNLVVNTATGSIDEAYLAAKQQEFYYDYMDPLVQNGDISGGSIVFTGPNFNATKKINFTLTIVSAPILGGATGVIKSSATL